MQPPSHPKDYTHNNRTFNDAITAQHWPVKACMSGWRQSIGARLAKVGDSMPYTRGGCGKKAATNINTNTLVLSVSRTCPPFRLLVSQPRVSESRSMFIHWITMYVSFQCFCQTHSLKTKLVATILLLELLMHVDDLLHFLFRAHEDT